jgi:hypothetical protein
MKRATNIKNTKKTSSFQSAIEAVETLPPEEQAMILEIIERRLARQRREDLVQRVAEARADYQRGLIRRGTAEEILADIDS